MEFGESDSGRGFWVDGFGGFSGIELGKKFVSDRNHLLE